MNTGAGDHGTDRAERLLAGWRREACAAGLGAEAIEELESHLRDAAEALVRETGLAPAEALLVARERLGDPAELGRELQRARVDAPWARTLRLGLAGYLVVTLGQMAAGTLATLVACLALALGASGLVAADAQLAVRGLALAAFALLLARAVAGARTGLPARLALRLRSALDSRRGTLQAGALLLAGLATDFVVRSWGLWWFTSRLDQAGLRDYQLRAYGGGTLVGMAFWLGAGAWLAWRARGRPAGTAATALESLFAGALVLQLAVQAASAALQTPLLLVSLARPGLVLFAALAMEAGFVVLLAAMLATWRAVRRAEAPMPPPSSRGRRLVLRLRDMWRQPLGPVAAALVLVLLRGLSLDVASGGARGLPPVDEAWAIAWLQASQVVSLLAAAAWPVLLLAAVARLQRPRLAA